MTKENYETDFVYTRMFTSFYFCLYRRIMNVTAHITSIPTPIQAPIVKYVFFYGDMQSCFEPRDIDKNVSTALLVVPLTSTTAALRLVPRE